MNYFRCGGGRTTHTATKIDVAKTPLATFQSNVSGLYIPEIIAYIQATQSGSGDPSPSNPRTINGVSSVDTTVCGNNLLDPTLLKDQAGWNIISLKIAPSTTFTFSSNISQEKSAELALMAFNSTGSPSSSTLVYSGHSVTFTTNADGIVKIQQRRISGTDSFANYEWQLQTGNTATPYEAYTGQTATTALGGTYYGGYLNVTTGLLTVTHEVVDLGSLNWVISSNMFINSDMRTVIKPATSNANPINGISSLYTITSYNGLNDMCLAVSTAGNVFIKNSAYTDAASFKTAMNGVQLVYELATPQTYQLTPAQLEQLLGQNNVFCSTGDVAVKYWKID